MKVEDRFWSKVATAGPDECWPWMASCGATGYGRFSWNGRNWLAHRVAWKLGGLDDAEVLDHVCHDPKVCKLGAGCPHRRCCNPAHMSPGTLLENVSGERGGRPMTYRTECPQGHPYSGDNLVITARGWRVCLICRRERGRILAREKRARKKLAAPGVS